ncbi:P-loop containing nucleoside triphosphate hydrolase protein [Annulohypoxylon truncatum]|uniref:P-loop containing nucleoside triphosphate hydrolase protein n=1 Tax=Annulohypoxylon truncatum TaxID=327061 RepID=UPI0020088345|nr:P-loop containing nucleoside triphosphate hydrolase protein [Annulohypoxylon truncatum]KAI1210818.1 P-loop containing nucleoside triphosphate hydrolase protein [Annulohypoxylon truncatum]
MSLFALTCRAPLRCSQLVRLTSIYSRHYERTRFNIRQFSSHTVTHQDTGIQYVRNIGIIAHVDAGKTTTTEQMLYNCGALNRPGHVDQGDTVTDFLPMERERGITIQSAAITFHWPPKERLELHSQPHVINLIDTPGHVDFRFEVERCMPILDGAICVIDGVEGVEAHTERVWASAQEFKVPRIIYVNKLDRDGASFKKSVQDIGLKLGGMPLVCQIPWWGKDSVKGVVDVISRSVVSWGGTKDSPDELSKMVPEGTIKDEIERARERLIEQLCEEDDELLEMFTAQGKDISDAAIKRSIRRIINKGDGSLIPVFAGASFRNIGVAALLDAVKDYLPSPSDRPELEVRIGRTYQPLGQVLESQKSSKKHQPHVEALASVFKVTHDPRRGMLTFVRVYHGVVRKNTHMWNTNLQEFERPLNMMQISAARTIEIPHLSPGQIGAITGLKTARTGDTLVVFAPSKAPQSELATLQVRPPEIPPAVAFIVLDAYSPTGAKTLETALENLSREDPSLRWSQDENTEQYTLSGMGTLHLEVARDRLENHYKAEAEWGAISVDYKECLIAPTPVHRAVFDKVVAGKPGKAACSVVIEPLGDHHRETLSGSYLERDGNIIKVICIGEGLIPDIEHTKQQLTNGVLSALARGPRRSSPMQQCLVTVTYDTSTDFFHEPPSSHLVGAANKAVREALKEAHEQQSIGVLEPVMKVTIVCPEVSAGAVQHDLHSARGGHVLEVQDVGEMQVREGAIIDVSDIYAPPDPYEFRTTLRETRTGRLRMLEITARVPFVEMLDYDTLLRGKTQGRHTLTMALDTFERVTGPREKAL